MKDSKTNKRESKAIDKKKEDKHRLNLRKEL